MGKHKPPRDVRQLIARATESVKNIDAHRAAMEKVAANAVDANGNNAQKGGVPK
jgi:hypothetical protein